MRDRVVADRFRLVRAQGPGAVGALWIATRLDGAAPVLLELVPCPAEPDPLAWRALDDVRADTAFDHPRAATPLEVTWDAGELALVWPMRHARDLASLLDDAPAALDAAESALGPLAAAHQAGLTHGRLGPTTVVVDANGAATVVGIGIDRALAAVGADAPRDPRWLAPEQLRGEAGGPPADVWAIGALMYRAHAGHGPFDDRSSDTAPLVPAREACPGIETNLASLVDLCLEKSPAERPPHAGALSRLMATMRSLAPWAVTDRTVIDQDGAGPPPPPDALSRALAAAPRAGATHRSLLAWYEAEGVDDGAWLAASALVSLGEASPDEARRARWCGAPITIPRDRSLDPANWAGLLHPDQDPRVDAVWTEIIDVLAAHVAEPADGLNELRPMSLGRSKEPASRLVADAISTFALSFIPRLYRGRPGDEGDDGSIRYVRTRPPSSILPAGFEEPLGHPALRFAIGRHVAGYRDALRAAILLPDPERLELAFRAAVLDEGDAPLANAIREAARERSEMGLVRRRFGADAKRIDLGMWRRAVELSVARAGLLFAGDLEASVWMLRWSRGPRRVPIDDAVDDLFAFWSSGEHVRLRHALLG